MVLLVMSLMVMVLFVPVVFIGTWLYDSVDWDRTLLGTLKKSLAISYALSLIFMIMIFVFV